MGRDGELLSRYPPRVGCWCCDNGTMDQMFLRNVKVGGEEHVWKRFTILSNVNGQKYTIGKKCTSREEQGEFIFMLHDILPQKEAVCEINVEEDKFFVTPLLQDSAVFINGVKIGKMAELEFGDNLALGVESNILLFKERELNPEAFIHPRIEKPSNIKSKSGKTLGVEFIPGQNGLILSHILSYLPIDEVKSARFVSKLWNEEAFKILKKRCTVSFRLYGYASNNESMKLFRYFAEMGNNLLPDMKIVMPGNGSLMGDKHNPAHGRMGTKRDEDLRWFLFNNSKMQFVKRLELGGDTNSQSGYELRLKLLQAVGNQLEELNWGGQWDLDKASGKDYPFPPNLYYKKLRVFTLSLWPVEGQYVQEDYPYGVAHDIAKNCSSMTWLQQLVKAISGVSTIRLECPASLSATFLTCLNELSTLFSNLKEITISKINPDVINILLELNKPLAKLGLYEFEGLKKQDFHEFNELLSKHAPTLKSLQFIIPPIPEGEGHLPPVFTALPTFPKLEELHVGWSMKLKRRNYHRKTDDAKLIFSDGSSFVNYERDLPSLKSLTLFPDPYLSESYGLWKDTLPLFRMFFPTITRENRGAVLEICKTVQVLGVFHSLPTRTKLFPETSEAKIAAMFPNVRNDAWIDSIRERDSNRKISKASKNKPKVDQPILGRLRSEARKLRPRPSGGGANIATTAAQTSRNLRPRKR